MFKIPKQAYTDEFKAQAERVNDVETPSCMKLRSKDRACWWWSSVWVD